MRVSLVTDVDANMFRANLSSTLGNPWGSPEVQYSTAALGGSSSLVMYSALVIWR